MEMQTILPDSDAPAPLDARPFDPHTAGATNLRCNEALTSQNWPRRVPPMNSRPGDENTDTAGRKRRQSMRSAVRQGPCVQVGCMLDLSPAVEIYHLCLSGHHVVNPIATMPKPERPIKTHAAPAVAVKGDARDCATLGPIIILGAALEALEITTSGDCRVKECATACNVNIAMAQALARRTASRSDLHQRIRCPLSAGAARKRRSANPRIRSRADGRPVSEAVVRTHATDAPPMGAHQLAVMSGLTSRRAQHDRVAILPAVASLHGNRAGASRRILHEEGPRRPRYAVYAHVSGAQQRTVDAAGTWLVPQKEHHAIGRLERRSNLQLPTRAYEDAPRVYAGSIEHSTSAVNKQLVAINVAR